VREGQVLGMMEGVHSRDRYMGRKREFGNAKELVKEFEREYGKEAEDIRQQELEKEEKKFS